MEKFDLYFFEEHYDNGAAVLRREDGETVKMVEFDDEYVTYNIPVSPDMVCQVRLYYPSTLTLKEEGHFLKKGGTRIGVWKKYDEFGGIVAEHDTDADFPVSWDQMAQRLREEKISLQEVTSIGRGKTREGVAEWRFTLCPAPKVLETVHFDAVTGILLKREKEIIKIRK